jgi:glycosyltransferase involved in cell wall biosynthesis
VLTYSSLFPNGVDATHGIFVARRLAELSRSASFSATVVAPVPWFPFRSAIFGRYGEFARIPRTEELFGWQVRHPRYPVIPKIGMLAAPQAMYKATLRSARSAIDEMGGIDLIDAHYLYPDAVAASRLADDLRVPMIITARGSDVNVIGRMKGPRRMILEAAQRARAVVAVSRALASGMRQMGIDDKKIHVMPNGVDLDRFHPGNRDLARRHLDTGGPVFLSVGALKEAKGHDVVIDAMRHLPEANLFIVGTGEYEKALRSRVSELKLTDRVSFTGRLSESDLIPYYQAADALMLMSRREGMPNVVLESLACGTPVIATDVGGIADVVTDPAMGILLEKRTAEAVAEAWHTLRDRNIDRGRVRRLAGRLTWDNTTAKLRELMEYCATGLPEATDQHRMKPLGRSIG